MKSLEIKVQSNQDVLTVPFISPATCVNTIHCCQPYTPWSWIPHYFSVWDPLGKLSDTESKNTVSLLWKPPWLLVFCKAVFHITFAASTCLRSHWYHKSWNKFMPFLREQSRGRGKMTQERNWSFSLWNFLEKKLKNEKIEVELSFLLMTLWNRLICWGAILLVKLLNIEFEIKKWSNYPNQNFETPSGSTGGKTLKNPSKKKYDKMQSYEEEGTPKSYKLLFYIYQT